jgi:hypothetical protein
LLLVDHENSFHRLALSPSSSPTLGSLPICFSLRFFRAALAAYFLSGDEAGGQAEVKLTLRLCIAPDEEDDDDDAGKGR